MNNKQEQNHLVTFIHLITSYQRTEKQGHCKVKYSGCVLGCGFGVWLMGFSINFISMSEYNICRQTHIPYTSCHKNHFSSPHTHNLFSQEFMRKKLTLGNEEICHLKKWNYQKGTMLSFHLLNLEKMWLKYTRPFLGFTLK